VELQGVDYGLFKQEISSHPSVAGVSATDVVLCTGSRGIMRVKSPENGEDREIDFLAVDERFLENHGMALLAGRPFPPAAGGDRDRLAIINEKAVAALRLSSPQDAVGGPLVLGNGKSLEIVGVVRDFPSQSLDGEIRPLVLRIMPQYFRYANIRLEPGDPGPVLDFLAEKWKGLEPYEPFTFAFLTDQIAAYQEEGHSLLRAVSFIAFLALTIAFFGLLGMVIYDMDARVKEIGVRKVLGASVAGIAVSLSRGFVVLLALGAALATPAAWVFNRMVLLESANRIRLGPGIFGLGFLFLLALGLATIFSQTIRAAAGDPVDSLRYE
jgi:putative ABC transport system permease protein